MEFRCNISVYRDEKQAFHNFSRLTVRLTHLHCNKTWAFRAQFNWFLSRRNCSALRVADTLSMLLYGDILQVNFNAIGIKRYADEGVSTRARIHPDFSIRESGFYNKK